MSDILENDALHYYVSSPGNMAYIHRVSYWLVCRGAREFEIARRREEANHAKARHPKSKFTHRLWTTEHVALVRDHYHVDMTGPQLVKATGHTLKAVYNQARKMGLNKKIATSHTS